MKIKNYFTLWGTWVAQSVGQPTLDFGSGHDPRVMGSSPMSGSTLSMEPKILSLPLPLFFVLTHVLSPSLKLNKKKN